MLARSNRGAALGQEEEGLPPSLSRKKERGYPPPPSAWVPPAEAYLFPPPLPPPLEASFLPPSAYTDGVPHINA